jgi:hypothetical protein
MVSCFKNKKTMFCSLFFKMHWVGPIGMVLCGELGRLQLGIGLDLVAHTAENKKKREKTICFCKVATHPFV